MSEPVFLVSHFHWDREWYRAFEEFRGRLVDAIDAVLDLVRDDPGFKFVLDGQAIVLEDYLAIRPHRRAELEAGLRAGRLAAGPWYVQPDSLLPGGETHVRNLLHGRAVAGAFGPVSHVAYVPDSFGHPGQFPQLFAGFGLDPFVYWRGNGTELDTLGPVYAWRAPDGSVVRAWHLTEGYFSAGGLDADGDPIATAERVREVMKRIEAAGTQPVLLMNGFDHLPADASTAAVAREIGARRVLLDETVGALPPVEHLRAFEGDLAGARIANLLPGVWSSRMRLKLRNRACETLLTRWVEPWTAFAVAFGLPDERPALTQAWRTLLCNQAHDSIGGCSIDAVHERMLARYDDVDGLGRATLQRVLERLAGRNAVRDTPWEEAQDVVVFNASPHDVADVVRVPLEGFPPWRMSATRFDFHPLSLPSFTGVTVDRQPARLVPSDDPARVRFLPGLGGFDVEFVARAVPAFGCRRYRVEPADAAADEIDDGRDITGVHADDDGTLTVTIGDRVYTGLFAVEDCIDRGDSYDADPDPARDLALHTLSVTRTRSASGIERLHVTRDFAEIGVLTVEATVAPGVPFVRCEVAFDNRAPDHRLRLRFATGAPIDEFRAATTFDAARRSTVLADATGWVHGAPTTFAQHGWIEANGLVVGAPGLPEAEVTAAGDVLITLVRSVGALARLELRTRPMPAGPEMLAPGAQELGAIRATITLAATIGATHAAETGLVGVLGGDAPRIDDGTSLLRVVAASSSLSACKAAEAGDGIVVRILNGGDHADDVELQFGVVVDSALAVRLDESPSNEPVQHRDRTVAFTVPPHALRSVRVTFAQAERR